MSVDMRSLQQKIDEDIAEMKSRYPAVSSFFSFNKKDNADLVDKAIKEMSELIANNHHALNEIRKLQDASRDAVKLNNGVSDSAHNELLKSYENLKLTIKEVQRMNAEKDMSINKLRKQCTSMHKENTRLRAEIKALKSQKN